MLRRSAILSVPLLMLSGLVLFFTVVIPGEAQTGAQTELISIAAPAFIPASSDTVYDYDELIRLSTQPNIAREVFFAPVYFPSGARVTRLSAWVEDGSEEFDLSIALCGMNFPGAPPEGCNGYIVIDSSEVEGEAELSIDSDVEIQNAFQAYFIRLILPADSLLSVVQLQYEVIE